MTEQEALYGMMITLITSVGYVSYIRNIVPWFRRDGAEPAEPERRAWTIWAIQYTVLSLAQAREGATVSLVLTIAQLLGVLAVFGLSFWFGAGAFDWLGWLALAGVVLGLVLWWWQQNGLYAIGVSLAIEVVGMLFCWFKTYRSPYSETYIMWMSAGLAGLLTVVSVGTTPNLVLYLCPGCLAAVNLIMVAIIWIGRRRQQVLVPAH